MSNKKLPTKKEFQAQADKIKQEQKISRCQANEVLAKKYGYHTYRDIKDKFAEEVKTHQPQIITHEEFYKMQERQYFSNGHPTINFKKYHRFENQTLIDGVAYEPNLPNDFWNNDNNDRELEELENWWNIAFIVSNKNGYFIVYRLDGGAWDRPTRRGTYDNFIDALIEAQELNNLPTTDGYKYITLSDKSVVNESGLLITKDGKLTDTHISDNNSPIDRVQILSSLYFINNVLEKRENINRTIGTSYTLKHRVEDYFHEYYKHIYISNGAMIVALDKAGFKIKSLSNMSSNVYTNCKKPVDFNIKLEKKLYHFSKNEYLEFIQNKYI